MSKILTLLVLVSSLALSACGTTQPSVPLTQAQLDARAIDRELVLATAAIKTTYGALQTPGLSPAVQADIKAAVAGLAGGISTQVSVLQSGGSLTSQAVGALSGAVSGALPSLGNILQAAHGSSATAEEVALSAGESSFSQAPAVAALIINNLDGSWVPSADKLASDAKALQDAAAEVASYGQSAKAL